MEVSFTSNFLLQGVNITRTEKFQPVTTFGNTYGFFFGEQPVTFTYSAVLLNSADFQWQVEWWANYEENFRGTALTERNVRAYMDYDDFVVEGYILNAVTSSNSLTPHEVPLNFSMWVTNITYKATPGDRHFPSTSETALDFPDFSLDVRNVAGEFVSTTAAVRAGNIQALAAAQEASGLVGWIRNAVNDVNSFVGATGATLNLAKNALYGRTIRIPAGFAASDVNAGPASFASGSGFEALDLTQFVTVRLPPEFINKKTAPRTSFFANKDEYPFSNSNPGTDNPLSSSFLILQDGGEVDSENPESVATNADILRKAEEAWADAGFKGTTNEFGGGLTSEVGLAMAKATFGAISYGASFGSVQILDRLTRNPLNASANAATGRGFTNTVGGGFILQNGGSSTPAAQRRSLPQTLSGS
jgi:hypothetical protein